MRSAKAEPLGYSTGAGPAPSAMAGIFLVVSCKLLQPWREPVSPDSCTHKPARCDASHSDSGCARCIVALSSSLWMERAGSNRQQIMSTAMVETWYHSNKYTAEVACEHCQGVVRHEDWCITRSSRVLYAYEAVADSSKLTLQDILILHALGVSWSDHGCRGTCVKDNPSRPTKQSL